MNWNAYTFHGKSLLNAQKEEEKLLLILIKRLKHMCNLIQLFPQNATFSS